MIFKFLKDLIYGYSITSEQVVLLDLIYSSESELEYYLNTFPEDKKKLLQNLLRRGFIKEEDGIYYLDEKGFEVINNFKNFNKIYCEEMFQPLENELPSLVEEYRSLFEGLKPGSLGSKSGCINKMKKFLKSNPKVTKEEIINATKLYIDSFKGNYQYLQQADYFINKEGSSRLETWIEEVQKGNKTLGDWTTKIV